MRRFYALSLVIAVLCVTLVQAAETASYPRPRLLIEPGRLAKAKPGQFVILDVRSQEAYDEGHIPGAIRVDHDEWKDAFGDGSDAEAWSKRIGGLGIGPESSVVAYDGSACKEAGRIWWILRYWGVSDARLLNGGWKAWNAKKLPVSTEATPAPEAAEFKATPAKRRLVSKAQVLRAIKDHRFQIIDTRSNDENCGIDLKKNLRGGHIPGARHLDWVNLVDPETDRFKSPEELRKLFDEAGIDINQPTASHCQSGGRASVMVFALELMGAKNAGNYYPGWSEWGNLEDTPIEKPEAEEKKPEAGEKSEK
ncbi:MAG: sulfurtransferase [Planctomycetaceae bacterium]|nr:sulfurtransferase [Planctomycetaceae bacterium]